MKPNGMKNRNNLSEREINIIDAIYLLRGLTREQIWQLYFKKEDGNPNAGMEYCKKVLYNLKCRGFIKRVHFRQNVDVYFLTTSGVSTAVAGLSSNGKHCNPAFLPSSSNHYTASQLEFDAGIALHQIALNDFIIKLIKSNYPLSWIYFHEKFASRRFTGARPDGILELKDTIFFLEQDMATEGVRKLQSRCELYRSFKRTQNLSGKKVKILFIIDSINVDLRASLIKKVIQDNIGDIIDDNFDICLGNLEEISTMVINHFKELCGDTYADVLFSLGMHGYKCDKDVPKKLFGDTPFDYYARKLNENGKLATENGHVQEFIIDDYQYSDQRVISKIRNFPQLNASFKSKHGRNIIYLVIAKDLTLLYKDISNANLLNTDNVVYSTLDLLTGDKPINECVFTFDGLKNIFSFKDSSFTTKVKVDVIH